MTDAIIDMAIDLQQMKTAFGNAIKVGPVEAVDAAKGFRLKLGEDAQGNPYLSPWYPHPESGGATKTWAPLSKGQIVGVANPHGDPRQGLIFRGGFSGQNPPPSDDLDANVFTFGGVTVTVKGGAMTIEADHVAFVGTSVTHNGVAIGETHKHTDVEPGGGKSGPPES